MLSTQKTNKQTKMSSQRSRPVPAHRRPWPMRKDPGWSCKPGAICCAPGTPFFHANSAVVSGTPELPPKRSAQGAAMEKKKTTNVACHHTTRLPLFLTPNTPSFKTSYFLLTFHHTTHSTLILLSHSPLNNPHSYYHITIAPLTIHIHSLLTCHSHHMCVYLWQSSHRPCVCLPFSLLFLAMFLRH